MVVLPLPTWVSHCALSAGWWLVPGQLYIYNVICNKRGVDRPPAVLMIFLFLSRPRGWRGGGRDSGVHIAPVRTLYASTDAGDDGVMSYITDADTVPLHIAQYQAAAVGGGASQLACDITLCDCLTSWTQFDNMEHAVPLNPTILLYNLYLHIIYIIVDT